MTAPRRLQLRRGNTAATSTYVGAAGELVVNTTTNTLYLHDGSTVGGYATTTNTAVINNQISSVNANITLANTGMRGYVDATIAANIANIAVASTYSNINVKAYTESMGYQNFGNVNVAAYVTTANSAIIGYIDLANTIQSAQVGAANLAITAANLGMKGYVDSVASQSIYGNGNVKSYLTQFDGNIIPSANTVFSLGSVTNQWRDLFVSNNTIYVGGVPIGIDTTGNLTINGTVIPTISYVNTVVANVVVDLSSYALNANVTAANVGLKGYVDFANTTMKAYVDGQIIAANANVSSGGGANYGNSNVASYLPTYTGNLGPQTFGSNIKIGGITFPGSRFIEGHEGLTFLGAGVQVNGSFTVDTTSNPVGTQFQIGTSGQSVSTFLLYGQNELKLPESSGAIYSDQYKFRANGVSVLTTLNNTIIAANVGMRGYVDSQSFYSNVKVATYLPTYSGNIAANISKAGYTWTFGTDAVLTLPSGATILESGYGSAGAIRLKPNGGTSTQYLEIAPTTVDGNHVHLMAGSGTELFLGDDNHYVKLANTGGVVINSNDSAGNTAQWTFGKTGTTQFPNSLILAPVSQSITMQSDQYSQLMWENANVTVAPNMAINSNFYVAQNSATLDIGYRDGNSTQLIKSWLWSVDGNLTLPSGGYILNSDNSIYGAGSSYSNVEVATYLPTYSGNIANITLGPSGVLTFADGTTQITAGGAGGSYSNVDVTTFLANSRTTFFGNTSTHPLSNNVTQIFIGNSTALTSGNAISPFATSLMYNMYFAANNTPLVRNTQLGAGILSLDLNGFTVSGLATSQTANAAPTLTNLLRITSAGAATFVSTVTASAGVTSVGAIAVNSALGITSNQTSQLIFNQTVTTITMGTGAATTINLGTTAAPTSNVFVGGTLGTNVYGLTLRANGQFNLVTSLNSSGGYGIATYSNIAVTGGSGNGMIISMTGVASGYLSSASVTNPGTGYRSGDSITIPAGNPVGSLGGSFVLQNYHATRSNIGTGIWQFGIDGNLTLPGNVIFPSNSYIFGDFSNATVNARTVFTPTAANASPGIYAAPSGSGTGASWQAANSGNLTAASKILIATNGSTDVQLVSGINGSGTYLPLSFYNNGSAQMQLTVAGNLNMTVNNSVATSGTGYFIGNAVGTTANYTGNVTAQNLIGNISITGNVTGTSSNVTLQAGAYTSVFDNQGNVTVPRLFTAGNIQTAGYFVGNGTLLTGVAIKTTGSWTVPTGNSTQSFTVPTSGTYQLWVDCNIANGILAWNATATVTNSNVPVVGQQFAWSTTVVEHPLTLPAYLISLWALETP
jgi:hypothetical protein